MEDDKNTHMTLHHACAMLSTELASTTGFILAPTAVAQTACKRQQRCCFWLAIYFYT